MEERKLDNPEDIVAQAILLAERGRQFPGAIYASAAVHQLELDRIFRADWQMVGRVENFELAGDYEVYKIAGESILVTRGTDGELRAFHNLCLHRGAEIAHGKGNARRFLCPYHSWCYRNDGALIGVPMKDDFKDFDPSGQKLAPVKLETWGGFLFVNLDGDARPLAETYGEILNRCTFIRAENLRMAWKFELEVDCNWKLVVENLYDVYHLNVVHANSFARDFDPRDFRLHTMSGGMFFGDYRSQSIAGPDGKTLFRSIDWLPGDEHMAFGAQVLPTLTLIGRHDAIYALVAEPIGHDRCRLTTYMLMPGDWFGEVDFQVKVDKYKDFMKLILAEDLALLASLQVGLSSRAYVPGPVSVLESPVLHLTRDILTRISSKS